MGFLENMSDTISRLGVFAELNVPAAELPDSALGLSDASVRDALGVVAGLVKQASTLQSVLAGVAAARSGRDRGHGGLVQGTGHRNTFEFIRDLTGATRGEAIRTVKVGEALLEGHGDGAGGPVADAGADRGEDVPPPAVPPWHEPLGVALLQGTLTSAQHDAIRTGLGDPPRIDGRESETVVDAWRAAARELATEAPACTVEDLAARARALKDLLDPVGAEGRYAARFAKRSYRWSTTPDGMRTARIVFDDELGEWVRTMMDAALSPRRGGPRFVTDDRKRQAEELVQDSRSNDLLAYDLFADVFRAGALATKDDVFGAKEAGVRLVTLTDTVAGGTVRRDVFGRLIATAHSEDGALTVPGSVLERALCVTGTLDITIDTHGNPLNLGREARLYTAGQKLVLAVRDGGCRWPGCDRPPAYCEAHHCEHWAHGGNTDIECGILLCRFHHLTLHNNGWRIQPTGDGQFLLHAPPGTGGAPIPLGSSSPLRWFTDPPQRRPWRQTA